MLNAMSLLSRFSRWLRESPAVNALSSTLLAKARLRRRARGASILADRDPGSSVIDWNRIQKKPIHR
jgi:hypothetical protein